jgi:hypothetical protein
MAYQITKTVLYENGDREIDVPVDFRNAQDELVLSGTLTEASKGMADLRKIHRNSGDTVRITNKREFGVVRKYSTIVYRIQEVQES